MWKFHAIYESHPHSVIVPLGGQLYRVQEVVMITTISFILEKQCQKMISQIVKFFLFMVLAYGESKVTTTDQVAPDTCNSPGGGTYKPRG